MAIYLFAADSNEAAQFALTPVRMFFGGFELVIAGVVALAVVVDRGVPSRGSCTRCALT